MSLLAPPDTLETTLQRLFCPIGGQAPPFSTSDHHTVQCSIAQYRAALRKLTFIPYLFFFFLLAPRIAGRTCSMV